MHEFRLNRAICVCFLALAAIAGAAQNQNIAITHDETSLLMRQGKDTLRITVCAPGIVHIVAGPGEPKSASPEMPWLVKSCTPGGFDFGQDDKQATLRTTALQVSIKLETGALTFRNSAGDTLLMESDRRTRVYTPDMVNGEKVYHVSDRFQPAPTEGFYGLGQHQSGVFQLPRQRRRTGPGQHRCGGSAALSTNGYGILWNTAAHSWFDNRFPTELKLSAEAADAIDYYFIYGPEIRPDHPRIPRPDGPRTAASASGPMALSSPKTATDRRKICSMWPTNIAHQHVPLDMIVQDWFWWKQQGDPDFHRRVPEALPRRSRRAPEAPRRACARHHLRVGRPRSEIGYLYRNSRTRTSSSLAPPTTTPPTPQLAICTGSCWSANVTSRDGTASGSTAPSPNAATATATPPSTDHQLSIGNGARYTNIFPLMHNGGVYDHWRATTDRKRVFILTRSAFAGPAALCHYRLVRRRDGHVPTFTAPDSRPV